MNPLLLFGGLFVAVYVALGAIALRRPLLARIALREASRRPLQTVLVIAGLMVASGAILAGQLLSDTTYDSYTVGAAQAWGRVDLVVDAGGRFFDHETAQRIAQDSSIQAAGVQGGIEIMGAVSDADRQSGKGFVPLIGFDTSKQAPFGSFTLLDGRQTDGRDLTSNEVLLSKALADSLHARPRDHLVVSVGQDQGGKTVALRVAGIARPEGPGAYGLRPSVFAPLAALEPLTGTGLINVVRITASGQGAAETKAAQQQLLPIERVLRGIDLPGGQLGVRSAKADDVSVEADVATNQSGFWTILPLFVLVAGVALAVNLALALAAERRPRLAILRALGLTRAGMVTIAVIEGAIYSLAGAVVGIVPGLVAAWPIVEGLSNVPSTQQHYGQTIPVNLSIRAASVILAIAIGTLVPLIAIFISSVFSSRIWVSAAIRDLPDPPALSRFRRVHIALAAILVVISLPGLAGSPGDRLLSGVGLIAATVLLVGRRLSVRTRASALGATLTVWPVLLQLTTRSISDQSGAPFVIGAFVVEVFGLSILVAANLRLLEVAAGLVGPASRVRARLRPPLAFTTRRPVRAGLSIGTFALVITVLTVYAALRGSIISQASSSDPGAIQTDAGFSVIVSSAGTGAIKLPPSLEAQVVKQEAVSTRPYLGVLRSSSPTSGSPAFPMDWHQEFIPLYELSVGQLQDPPLHLIGRDPRFLSDAAVWRALRDDPTWIISNRFGQTTDLTFMSPSGPVHRRVAAVYPPGLYGIAGSRDALSPLATTAHGSTLLVQPRPGVDPTNLAAQIRGALAGVDAVPVAELVNQGAQNFRDFASVPEQFMRLGLIVGVLSLGILAFRAVLERRRPIGVLRALGYRRRDMLAGVLAEGGLILTTGVVIGVGIGLAGAYLYLRAANPGTSLLLDGPDLAVAIIAVYAAVLLATIGPALQASRLAPAQALRLLE